MMDDSLRRKLAPKSLFSHHDMFMQVPRGRMSPGVPYTLHVGIAALNNATALPMWMLFPGRVTEVMSSNVITVLALKASPRNNWRGLSASTLTELCLLRL
jgi:hypothetical protein